MHWSNLSFFPVQIEAVSYMVAAAITKGDIMLHNVIPKHMECISAKLMEMGVPFGDHRAVQMTRADYDRYDLLLAADSANVRNMTRIAGGDPDHKIRRLLDDCPRPRDIADPWYTGDFEATWRDVLAGCRGLLETWTQIHADDAND